MRMFAPSVLPPVFNRMLKLWGRFLGFSGMFTAVANASAEASAPETVVLLHGMGRTRASMAPIAAALRRDGYHVVNVSYPSRTRSIESLAHEWLPEQLRLAGADRAP